MDDKTKTDLRDLLGSYWQALQNGDNDAIAECGLRLDMVNDAIREGNDDCSEDVEALCGLIDRCLDEHPLLVAATLTQAALLVLSVL